MTPAEIAARLTPAQKRALLCGRGLIKAHPRTRLCLYLLRLQDNRQITDLGQAVRAVLEQEQSDG